MQEPVHVREKRHLRFIDLNREALANASREAYRDEGRGAWILQRTKSGGQVYYISAAAAADCPADLGATHGGWFDGDCQRIVNTYDPDLQFVVIIGEDDLWSVYKCGFWSRAYEALVGKN